MSDWSGWLIRKRLLLCFILCGTASSTWCVTAGRQFDPTYDEPFYLEAGLKSWHQLRHKELIAAGTMPLPPEVDALPLLLGEWLRGIACG